MEKFCGTICVITGISAGIGNYLLQKFVEIPQLTVVGISRRKVDNVHANNFHWIKCDLSNPSQIKSSFEEIKSLYPKMRVSILINNAGGAKPMPLHMVNFYPLVGWPAMQITLMPQPVHFRRCYLSTYSGYR